MKTQPEALRLAEILEQTNQMHENADIGSQEVAAELRRQFEEIKRLHAIEEAAKNLVKVKGRYHTEQAFNKLKELVK